MSISLNIETPTREMREVLGRVESDLKQRRMLNRTIANRAEVFTADYLRTIARTRHSSARRLNARPSGHLERAAESVTSLSNAAAAHISITSPGFNRVAGPVTIRPKQARWLTIPIHRDAYNRRARGLARFIGRPLFRPGRTGAKARVLSAVDPNTGQLTHYYALVKQVTLPQDRTLLPSDSAYEETLLAGVRDYVDMLLRRVAR